MACDRRLGGVAAIHAGLYAWTGIKARKLCADEVAFERHVVDVQIE